MKPTVWDEAAFKPLLLQAFRKDLVLPTPPMTRRRRIKNKASEAKWRLRTAWQVLRWGYTDDD